jgi:hypothetical protein
MGGRGVHYKPPPTRAEGLGTTPSSSRRDKKRELIAEWAGKPDRIKVIHSISCCTDAFQ